MTGFFDLLPLLLAFFLPALSMPGSGRRRRKSPRSAALHAADPAACRRCSAEYLAALGALRVVPRVQLPIPVMLEVCSARRTEGRSWRGTSGSRSSADCSRDRRAALGAGARPDRGLRDEYLVGFALVLTGEERVAGVLDGLLPLARARVVPARARLGAAALRGVRARDHQAPRRATACCQGCSCGTALVLGAIKAGGWRVFPQPGTPGASPAPLCWPLPSPFRSGRW